MQLRHRPRPVLVERLETRQLMAQQPFSGTAIPVGATAVTVQAEDFDLGGEGTAYHDLDLGNGGGAIRTAEDVDLKLISGTNYRVNNTFAGEWVEYSLDVQQAGTYTMEFRVSSKGSNGTFHAELRDPGTDAVISNLTGSLTAPNTGSNTTWATVTKQVTFAATGPQVLRLAFDQNSTYGSVANFDWIRIAPPELPPPPPEPPASGGTATVTTTTGAYVRGGSFAGTNFGSSADLIVKRSSGSETTRETYLKFDLSALSGQYIRATLRLRGKLSGTGTPVRVQAFSASSNTSWSENTLTWSNKPASGTTALGEVTVRGTTATSFDVDLTSFINAELAAGRKLITLVLKGANTTSDYAIFSSDESSSNGPRLLMTAATPELTALQQAYVDQKYGMFIHFGYITFTDDQTVTPDVNRFNPSAVDTDQWAAVAKASGMKYGVLTTKHHPGYPLWDSNQTTFDVASSDWYKSEAEAGRDGDVVRRFSDSFRSQGLGVGLYYSVLDHHAGININSDPTWATNYVKAELTQLLTNYGDIEVLWTDGWGWNVKYTAVNWQDVYDHVKTISPNTLLMENNHEYTMVHSDLIGYERPVKETVPAGNTLPVEVCDTIRADGTWHYRTWDPELRSAQFLVDTGKTANARGATYLLNVGPNRDGVIPEKEVTRLREVEELWFG